VPRALGRSPSLRRPSWVCGVAQREELHSKTQLADSLASEVRDLKKRAVPTRPDQQPNAATCGTAATRVVHDGVGCSHCKTVPIVGTRYHLRGKSYDLCGTCILKLKNPDDKFTRFEKIERPRESEIVPQRGSVASGSGDRPESAGAAGGATKPAAVQPNADVATDSGSGYKRKVSSLSRLRLNDCSGGSESDGSDGLGSESETNTPQQGADDRTLRIDQDDFTLRRSAIMTRKRQDGTWYYIDLYCVRGDSLMLAYVPNVARGTISITCAGTTKRDHFVRIPTGDRPTSQECEGDVARFISALRGQLLIFRRNSATVRSRAMALFGRYDWPVTRLVHGQEAEVRAFFTFLAAAGTTARADRETWLASMDAAIAAAAAMPAPSAKPAAVGL
jgi:hypothetical protein